jgi:hypothetical protein
VGAVKNVIDPAAMGTDVFIHQSMHVFQFFFGYKAAVNGRLVGNNDDGESV